MHRFASVALVDERGWILMQERDEHAAVDPDRWGLPGGGLEPGESWAAAAVRELAEETGVVLGVPPEDLGSFRFFQPACDADDEFTLFWAPVRLTDRDVECHEGRQMAFVDPGVLGTLPLAEAARIALRALVASPGYRARHGVVAMPAEWPRDFVGVLLVDRSGRILLQERDQYPVIDPDTWGLCGGHLDEGEEPVHGALREVAEETGVRLAGETLRAWRVVAFDHAASRGTVDRMHVFAAATTLTDADIDCREGRRIVFCDPEDALTWRLSAAAAAVLPDFVGSSLHRALTETGQASRGADPARPIRSSAQA